MNCLHISNKINKNGINGYIIWQTIPMASIKIPKLIYKYHNLKIIFKK